MDANLSGAALKTGGSSLYEGLFLVDSADASANWDAVVAAVVNVLERVEAEIVSIRKWDERRLTYKINGKTRGTYILCYFRVAGTRIQEIERNIQLSTTIWRALILNAEQQTETDIEKDTPVTLAQKQQQKPQSAGQVVDSAQAKQADPAEQSQQPQSAGQVVDSAKEKQADPAEQSQQPQQDGQSQQPEPAVDVPKVEQEDKKSERQSNSQGSSD